VGCRGMLATLHADDGRDAVIRLSSHPMNVPVNLIPLLDLLIAVNLIEDKKLGIIRRVTEVAELSKVENNAAVNPIYSFDAVTKQLKRTQYPSQSREKLAKATGLPIAEIDKEIENRRTVLQFLLEKNIADQDDVNVFMKEYYAKIRKE